MLKKLQDEGFKGKKAGMRDKEPPGQTLKVKLSVLFSTTVPPFLFITPHNKKHWKWDIYSEV